MPREKANTEKCTVFFTAEAMARIEKEAVRKGITKSALIRMIVLEYLAKEQK